MFFRHNIVVVLVLFHFSTASAIGTDEEKAFLGARVSDSASPQGAKIDQVLADSPAANAELKADDVVVAIGGVKIDSAEALIAEVRKHKPGEAVTFAIVENRDGEELKRELKVVLGKAFPRFGEEALDYLGAHVFNAFRRDGALVTRVDIDTPAADAGLKKDDIVVAIGEERVENVNKLKSELRKHKPGDTATLTIVQKDDEQQIESVLQIVLRNPPPRVTSGTMYLGGILDGNWVNWGNLIILEGVGEVTRDLDMKQGGLLDVNLERQAVLEVKGNITVDGMLYAHFRSLKPKEGDRFEVIRNAASLNGQFSKLLLPDLPDGLQWEVVYDNVPGGVDLDGDGKHDVTLIVKNRN